LHEAGLRKLERPAGDEAKHLDEIPEMLACATWRGAKTLGLEDEYGIEEGKPAHLVVFDAPTPVEVLRLQPVRRWVIRSGRVIAETTPPATRLFHEGREETITFAPPERS